MGGYYRGGAVIPSVGVNLGRSDEGIFLLSDNKSGNSIAKGMASYVEPSGESGYVLYHARLKLPGNHYVVGRNLVCDDVEKDVFQRIEAATGQKRKVLGPNVFERPSRFALEEKVRNSDAIVEGEILHRQGFHLDTSTKDINFTNYGSVIVKVLKVFKGDIRDSIIELVYVDRGNDTAFDHTYGFNVREKEEGLLFLDKNNTQISKNKTLQSFKPELYDYSFARYQSRDSLGQSCIAVCNKTTYSNPELDLFEKIESLTGQKRKVLGPNTFEIEAAEKQQK
jgi:hypothetical protein